MINSEAIEKEFKKSEEKAKKIINDVIQVKNICNEARIKASKAKLEKALKYIPLMIECVNSYIKGEYKAIPTKSIIAILGAIIYFASPIDLIPDFLPIIGLSDDAMVVSMALKLVSLDLDEYEKWKNKENAIINVEEAEESK